MSESTSIAKAPRLLGVLPLFLAALGCGSSSPADDAGMSFEGGTDAGATTDASGAQDGSSSPDGLSSADVGPGRADAASQDVASQDVSRGDASAQDGGIPEGAIQDAPTGDASSTTPVYVTFYGWADNSPPGNAIAYPMNGGHPTLHNGAGGVGTYADPITFATAPAEFPQGTRLYVPFIEKYVMMEDSCGACTTDWNTRKWHIDIWMNSNGTENTGSLTGCESSWTRNQTDVEFNPPPTRTVTTAPLFDPSTNTCRTTP
jgi:3D (Asp-Asp-Asp) domain-containing protein